jgi:hypothetical protein
MTITQLQNDAVLDIQDVFGDNVPPLANVQTFNELLRRYANNTVPGHFYDAETKRWFGTRNPHLVAPGVTVECQTNAPEGVDRYAITVWTIDDNGDIRPTNVARRATLGTANRYAAELHKVWTAAGGTIQ